MEPKQKAGKPSRSIGGKRRSDKPIPADAYPELDTDLARDNLENDLPAADLEDL